MVQFLNIRSKAMRKYTIKKTFFYTDDSFIMNVFGLDGENEPMIITEDDIEYLESYIYDYEEEYGSESGLLDVLHEIEKELETVDEVQFIME